MRARNDLDTTGGGLVWALLQARAFVHEHAEVSPAASVGDGTRIWAGCAVRDGAVIGEECVLGTGVCVDTDVRIGNRVKVQNSVSVFSGVTIEDGVFVGPHVCFTNDLRPRAVNRDGGLKGAEDWSVVPTLVRTGAAIGANATVVCGVTIGRWAMVGAGAVVTSDVVDHGLVAGNPARLLGYVCMCGERVARPGPCGACTAGGLNGGCQ